MNSNYINGYHIPIIPTAMSNSIPVHLSASTVSNVMVNTELANDVAGSAFMFQETSLSSTITKCGSVYQPPPVNKGRALKRKLEEKTMDDNGQANKIVMFQGRDESYPDELNKLIHPLSCQLCKVQITSMKSAKDHYESKSHDRHISAWLAKNYTDMGLQSPAVKRLVKLGPSGPNAFHCDLCDLALTSLTHARQHYSGRKHKLVEQKRSKPSGNGYYSSEGKWVRTITKVETNPDLERRFGIGEKFVTEELVCGQPIHMPTAKTAAEADELSKNNASNQAVLSVNVVDDSLCCRVCNISVTSSSQMKMHLDGAKHQKKLRGLNAGIDDGLLPTKEQCTTPGEIESLIRGPTGDLKLDEELSMYRTPSGSYYCKLCNKLMNHVSILQQHLQGKKHQKSVRQQPNIV